MRTKPLISAALMLSVWLASSAHAADPRLERLLASGWKFQAGDPRGAEAPDFDDQGWKTVSLPHDWSIAGPADRANAIAHSEFTKWVVWRKDGSQSYLPRGIGWYRLEFNQSELAANQKMQLYFEGVYRESDVWLNGRLLGHHASGSTSFYYDLTDALRPGRNVLSVRCDARAKEGWWFEACGLYRPVHLLVTDKLSIPPWGVWVSTPEITAQKAVACVRTTLRNDYHQPREALVETCILDASGTEVARGQESLQARQSQEILQNLAISTPRLWSPDEPYLYRAITRVKVGEKLIDETQTTFGIRAFHFDPELGFFLNGKPTKLWGVANHLDIAALGGAIPPRVCFDTMRVLKESQTNLLRGAHNARTPAELDAADRLGIGVISETRYFDNSDFGLSSLRDMILRDRNHPSILVWSLGNEEEGKQGTPAGVAIAKDLIRVVRELDPYRATSLAQNHNFNQPCGFSDLFDVLGQNWRNQDEALEDHRLYPKRAVYTSEYNYNVGWERYASWPWMAGAACWAGFEYYGELGWPNKTWPGQIADLCHEPNEAYHRARAQWGRRPMVWIGNSWKGQAGKSAALEGVTNCEAVKIYVNGELKKTLLKKNPFTLQDQLWRLVKLAENRRMLLAHDGRALESSALHLVAADSASAAQQWTLLSHSDGSVSLQAGDGRVLNVMGESRDDAASVQLYPGSGQVPHERWKLQAQDGGFLRLIAAHSGKLLTPATPQGGLMQYAPAEISPTYLSTANAALKFDLPFVPESTLRVDGLVGGKVLASHEITALGDPTQLVLTSTTPTLRNDSMDTAILRCGIADSRGNIIGNVDRKVRITVTGEGSFAGSGNADRDLTKTGGIPPTSPETATYKGLCQFALRAGNKPGTILAHVEAEGLQSADLKLTVTPDADPQALDNHPQGEILPPDQAASGFVVKTIALSNLSIASNQTVEARCSIGNLASAYPVEVGIALDGQNVSTERFSVPLGGDREIAVVLPKIYAEGEHALSVTMRRNGQVFDTRAFTLTVRSTPVAMVAETLDLTAYAPEGGEVKVHALVRNIGSTPAVGFEVPILLDGQPSVTSKVTLKPGETGEIHGAFPAPGGERHDVTVGGKTSTLTILKAFKPGQGLEVIGAPAKVAGKTAKALKFSGLKEFLKITPVDLREKPFTIWMRCKLDALDSETKESPLLSGGKTADQAGLRAGFHDGKVYFSIWGARDLYSSAKVPAGEWVDLAFVLDAKFTPKQTGPSGVDLQAAFWSAQQRIYINGKPQGDGESKIYKGDLSQLGAFWGQDKTFNGLIEEVKVFPQALASQQLESLSRDPAALKEPTILWVNFNE